MLKERRCRFRVLGLSATPGGKRESIQVCLLRPLSCELGLGAVTVFASATRDSGSARQGTVACTHGCLAHAQPCSLAAVVPRGCADTGGWWVQEVLTNLMVSAIEYRGETDPDVIPFRHERCAALFLLAWRSLHAATRPACCPPQPATQGTTGPSLLRLDHRHS